MGLLSTLSESFAKRGVYGSLSYAMRREFSSLNKDMDRASKSETSQKVMNPVVKRMENVMRQRENKKNGTNHTIATDLNNMAFMDKTDGVAKSTLNKVMSFNLLKRPKDPIKEKPKVIERIQLTDVQGLNADVGVVDSEYDYVKSRSKNLSVPENSTAFEKMNQALFNPKDFAYDAMTKGIQGLDDSNERLIIESAPYTRSEKIQSQITPTQSEYSGKRLKVLQQFAEDSRRKRGADDVEMGDYTWAHMHYMDLENKDKDMLKYMEDSVSDTKGMGLKPVKTEKEMSQDFEKEQQSEKMDFGLTWAERNEQYKRDNPDYVARQNKELQTEHEKDDELQMA